MIGNDGAGFFLHSKKVPKKVGNAHNRGINDISECYIAIIGFGHNV